MDVRTAKTAFPLENAFIGSLAFGYGLWGLGDQLCCVCEHPQGAKKRR